MAFDCLAIGIGLVASVMAHWPPNEKFTYGYVKTPTLVVYPKLKAYRYYTDIAGSKRSLASRTEYS